MNTQPDGVPPQPSAGPEFPARSGGSSASAWSSAGASAQGSFEQRRFALQAGIFLFVAAGLSTVLDAVVSPGVSTHARDEIVLVGSASTLSGAAMAVLRRANWSRLALLAMVGPALVLFASGNVVVTDPYRAGMFLFGIAVWVGFGQRQGVNLALAPLYAMVYWLPLWLQPHYSTLNGSVPYVVIVAVVTGEAVAWLTSRLASVSDRLRGQDLRRFAALDEESSDVTMVLDRSGTLTYVTASLTPLFGYRVDELQGHPSVEVMARFMKAEDAARAEAALRLALATPGGHASLDTKIQRADGAWRTIEIKIRNLLDDADVDAVLLHFWDITDRVEARASLEASEESFRLLFQLSPLPKMVLDPNTLRFLRVNDAACARYGYTQEQFLTMTIRDLVPTQPGATIGPVTDAPVGGYLQAGPWQHRTREGRVIDVEVAVNRTRFAGAEATMMLVVDVTEQRLLEAQLRRLALHDSLTGLANRALLQDRLGRALPPPPVRPRRSPSCFATSTASS